MADCEKSVQQWEFEDLDGIRKCVKELDFWDCGILMNVVAVSYPGLAAKEDIHVAEPAAPPAMLIPQFRLHSREIEHSEL